MVKIESGNIAIAVRLGGIALARSFGRTELRQTGSRGAYYCMCSARQMHDQATDAICGAAVVSPSENFSAHSMHHRHMAGFPAIDFSKGRPAAASPLPSHCGELRHFVTMLVTTGLNQTGRPAAVVSTAWANGTNMTGPNWMEYISSDEFRDGMDFTKSTSHVKATYATPARAAGIPPTAYNPCCRQFC
ncbi:hypothetical protein MKZ38_003769 [Zalerion maritima]|uniref:Uncharacterized protein n=1 Tax=Zalerion maritima TaxID=339359 RepID=A0AAD5RN28_9PEZI|nr:hypothetical protein MKZ38_003769 [Zalerion maritima]